MRDIKFRGKRIFDNKWVYGNLANGNVIPFDYFEEDGHHLICNSDIPIFTRKETIGQYTGIKDKNGEEIYEGDVLEMQFCNLWREIEGYNKVKKEVAFKDGKFGVLQQEGHIQTILDLNDIRVFSFEIIGNIYENPELMKNNE